VIAELRALVGRYPLREGLQHALMIALYRAGRVAEALEVYRRTRTMLVEELGVEPGSELRDLHQAVLDRSPSLDPQPHTAYPRQLPAAIADFTGREGQLSVLRQYLGGDRDQAPPYGVRIAGICGPGGVGKSTLAIRAAHELAVAFPDGQLYADVRAAGGDDPAATTLNRFLGALGVDGSAIPQNLSERAELYRSRMAGRRILVLLDDVTDESEVVPLLPGDAGCGVIVTSRARLTGLAGVHLVDVETLDPDRSVQMLTRLLGAGRVMGEPGATRRLAELCEGLPLALRISAARLAARPHWQIGQLVARLLDETRRLDELAHHGLELRATIGLSYLSIDDEARRLFRLFALVEAPDAPAWTAAALLDADPAPASEALDRLVEAQLVTAVRYDDARGVRYRFHDLIRVYAAEVLADTETAQDRDGALARLLGGWLALADAAHRKIYGGDYTVVHGSAPRWQPEDGEFSDPMAWFDRERTALTTAVRQAAAAGLDELCWDLALTLVTLFEVKGYAEDWLATSTIALKAAERAGNGLGRAAMQYSLGTLHNQFRRADEASELLAVAAAGFEAEGNDHGVGLALRNLAIAERARGNLAAARTLSAKALELLRSAPDPVGEAHLLSRLALVEVEAGDLIAARRLADESLELFRRSGYRRGIAQALHVSATVPDRANEPDAARAAAEEALDLVRELDDQVGTVHALIALGQAERHAGRPDRAVELLRQAGDLATVLRRDFLTRRAQEALDAIERDSC
jgi:tetratricopeptide (TPR) repeat protein